MPTAINTQACGTCENYDPVMRGLSGKGGVRETVWGWCSKRSTYPFKEGPGQRFPSNVTRVEEGEMPKPVIVRKVQVVSNCTLYSLKKNKMSKADLLEQLKAKSGGRIIG